MIKFLVPATFGQMLLASWIALLVLFALALEAWPAERIECRASRGGGGYWAYRQVEGRRCWYRGPRGLSKSKLTWKKRAELPEAPPAPEPRPWGAASAPVAHAGITQVMEERLRPKDAGAEEYARPVRTVTISRGDQEPNAIDLLADAPVAVRAEAPNYWVRGGLSALLVFLLVLGAQLATRVDWAWRK